MTTDITLLRAARDQAAAKCADLKAKRKAHANLHNEGADGYNPYDRQLELSISELVKADAALTDAEFWIEWTADVFAARRAAWNAAVMALPGADKGQVTQADVIRLESRLGYKAVSLAKAKARYVK